MIGLRRLHRTRHILIRERGGHQLLIQPLREHLHCILQLLLRRLTLSALLLVCLHRREEQQRRPFIPLRADRRLREIDRLILELHALSLPFLLHTLLELRTCFLLEVFHHTGAQNILRVSSCLLQPLRIRIRHIVPEEIIQCLLAAHLLHRTPAFIQLCRLDLFLGSDHARHHRLHLRRRFAAHILHELIDPTEQLLEPAEHPAQCLRRRLPLIEIQLEPACKTLMPPAIPCRPQSDRIARFQRITNRRLMCAELFRPRRIFVLLRRPLVPLGPFIHRGKILCRRLIELRQLIQIIQEQMPHLMQHRRGIRPRKERNDLLAVLL